MPYKIVKANKEKHMLVVLCPKCGCLTPVYNSADDAGNLEMPAKCSQCGMTASKATWKLDWYEMQRKATTKDMCLNSFGFVPALVLFLCVLYTQLSNSSKDSYIAALVFLGGFVVFFGIRDYKTLQFRKGFNSGWNSLDTQFDAICRKEKMERENCINTAVSKYKAYVQENIKPNDYAIIRTNSKTQFYVWRDEKALFFYPQIDISENPEATLTASVDTIRLADIVYYEQRGYVRQETKVSGGNSGITGAAIGMWLAGPLGAALLNNASEVQSDTILHDERETCLYLSKDKVSTEAIFPWNQYPVFVKLMPEKAKDYVAKAAAAVDVEQNGDIKKRLVTLDMLKEQHLVSEEEYTTKRGEILSSL